MPTYLYTLQYTQVSCKPACMHTFMSKNSFLHVGLRLCMYARWAVYVYVQVYMYVHAPMRNHEHAYICMYVSVWVCKCAYMCIHMHMHVFTHRRSPTKQKQEEDEQVVEFEEDIFSHVCMHVCKWHVHVSQVCIYASMYVCMYVINVCMFVCW